MAKKRMMRIWSVKDFAARREPPLWGKTAFHHVAANAKNLSRTSKVLKYGGIFLWVLSELDDLYDFLEDSASTLARTWLTLRQTMNPALAIGQAMGFYDFALNDPVIGDALKRWIIIGQHKPALQAFMDALNETNFHRWLIPRGYSGKAETMRFRPEVFLPYFAEKFGDYQEDLSARERMMCINVLFSWARNQLLLDDARWAATLAAAAYTPDNDTCRLFVRDLLLDLNEEMDDRSILPAEILGTAYKIDFEPDTMIGAIDRVMGVDSPGGWIGPTEYNPWGIDAPMLAEPRTYTQHGAALKAHDKIDEIDELLMTDLDADPVIFDFWSRLKKKLKKKILPKVQGLISKAAPMLKKFVPAIGGAMTLITGARKLLGPAKAKAIAEKVKPIMQGKAPVSELKQIAAQVKEETAPMVRAMTQSGVEEAQVQQAAAEPAIPTRTIRQVAEEARETATYPIEQYAPRIVSRTPPEEEYESEYEEEGEYYPEEEEEYYEDDTNVANYG